MEVGGHGVLVRDNAQDAATANRAVVDPGLYSCVSELAAGLASAFTDWRMASGASVCDDARYLAAVLGNISEQRAAAGLPKQVFASALQSATGAFPDEPFVAMYARCHAGLVPFLEGISPGVNVIFERGDVSLWNDLQRESGLMRHYSTLAADRIASLKASRHILEVGGGTRAATRRVVRDSRLSLDRYVFTDVSAAFIREARSEFADVAGFSAERLDIDRCPLSQGFEQGVYDAILAVNVIHVAKDPASTLRSLTSLLAPDGVILLSEGAPAPGEGIWAAEPVFAFLPQWAGQPGRSNPFSGFYSLDDWRRIVAQTALGIADAPAPPWYGSDQWGGVLTLGRRND